MRSSIEEYPPQRWCWLVWGLNLAYSIPDSTAQRSTAFLLILVEEGQLCGERKMPLWKTLEIMTPSVLCYKRVAIVCGVARFTLS